MEHAFRLLEHLPNETEVTILPRASKTKRREHIMHKSLGYVAVICHVLGTNGKNLSSNQVSMNKRTRMEPKACVGMSA
jgi:hypothetical protein